MLTLLPTLLLMLVACEKKPPAAPPKPRAVPARVENLPNYQKAIIVMRRMDHTPAAIQKARRAMPDLLAKAEARYIKQPESAATCAAWDRVAENAVRQNDPALVHVWGTLADRRCEQSGQKTHYWEAQ